MWAWRSGCDLRLFESAAGCDIVVASTGKRSGEKGSAMTAVYVFCDVLCRVVRPFTQTRR
jgi:hypothetical protein